MTFSDFVAELDAAYCPEALYDALSEYVPFFNTEAAGEHVPLYLTTLEPGTGVSFATQSNFEPAVTFTVPAGFVPFTDGVTVTEKTPTCSWPLLSVLGEEDSVVVVASTNTAPMSQV